MKIYLAARFDRHPEMREIRDRLAKMGHRVTSTWIDIAQPKSPEEGEVAARSDLYDVRAADAIVAFTDVPSSTGGTHVEFGIGLAAEKGMFVVGPRENIFHALAEQFATVDEWLAELDERFATVEERLAAR
jgi:nucleoside 2-deoxyribosyltransferase